MRRLPIQTSAVWLLVLALAVAACAPSQTAVDSVIVGTETARPSATATTIDTPTPEPTPTIAPTDPPAPSVTPLPTSTPLPPLSDVAITFDVIDGLLEGYYRQTPLDLTFQLDFDGAVEQLGWVYRSRLSEGGDITLVLVSYADKQVACSKLANVQANYRSDGYGRIVNPVPINSGDGMFHDVDGGRLLLAYCQGPVLVFVDYDLVVGVEPDDGSTFLGLLGRAQMERLVEAGYDS